jgi:hypothetical protein
MSVVVEPVTSPPEVGDHDRLAHWASAAEVAEAYVTGKPIMALCGKFWTPSRDPEKFPICGTCAEIKEAIGWR